MEALEEKGAGAWSGVAGLVSALDKFAAALSKLDQQSSYRMSTVRAELNLDTRPTQEAVESFAEYFQAESETAELAKGGKEAAPKVKAMGGAGKEEAGPWKPSGGSRGWWICQGRANGTRPTRVAGLARTASLPVWDSLDRQKERRWNCGSLEHRKAECPRPGPQGGGPGGGQAAAGGGEGAKRRAGTLPENKGAVRKAAGGKSHAAEPVVEEEMGRTMAEATQLLKSLRMKKLKAAKLSKIGECQSWWSLRMAEAVLPGSPDGGGSEVGGGAGGVQQGIAPEGGYSGDQEHEEAGRQEGFMRQGGRGMEEGRDGEGERGVRAALPGVAGGAAGENPGHRRRKGNRLEPGGEEEACQGDRGDPTSLRREECEEVQLRAVGQGGHCGGYPVGPGFAGGGHLRVPGWFGGGRKDGGGHGWTAV